MQRKLDSEHNGLCELECPLNLNLNFLNDFRWWNDRLRMRKIHLSQITEYFYYARIGCTNQVHK